MAVDSQISANKENAAIDMNIQMAVDDLSAILHQPVEKVLVKFLQSRTCAMLYDRETKLWWDGPSAIVELYLEENENKDNEEAERLLKH